MQNNQEIDCFCQDVKMLREKNGLIKKMSKIIEIYTASLTKIEKGILPHGANARIIVKFCKRFNIKPCERFIP